MSAATSTQQQQQQILALQLQANCCHLCESIGWYYSHVCERHYGLNGPHFDRGDCRWRTQLVCRGCKDLLMRRRDFCPANLDWVRERYAAKASRLRPAGADKQQ